MCVCVCVCVCMSCVYVYLCVCVCVCVLSNGKTPAEDRMGQEFCILEHIYAHILYPGKVGGGGGRSHVLTLG